MSDREILPDSFYCSSLAESELDSVYAIEELSYSRPWTRELLQNEFSNPISLRVALRKTDLLIGYSFNHVVLDELHILNVAILPAYRNLGLGELLILDTLHQAAISGAKTAYLEVRKSNTSALRLYQKCGFIQTGVRKCYYSDNGEDAILMKSAIATPEFLGG